MTKKQCDTNKKHCKKQEQKIAKNNKKRKKGKNIKKFK